jgi:hypothetical protein
MLEIFNGVDIFYFLIFIICVLVIFIYGRYRCLNTRYKDPLQRKLFKKISGHDLDGWSAVHFMFYLFVGFLYPSSIILTIILSIIWELFETWVGLTKPKFLENYGFCKVATDKKNNNKIWWYGKLSDIIVNLLGFLLGKNINNYFNNKQYTFQIGNS